ncbi:hypothetical protein DNTS_020765 [Danionella cerebrum]|uniref:Coiled-coil domain-containing protein 36 n=1 Tax=Danionella cerebrum TaxID=2873325 RepID=A0A553MPB6_9TELE|nr:hypothetical protein DNTS_020765 [Danionella translucida]
MKPNLWNIKEMLSIPSSSGGMKYCKGQGTSDYSSLSDSQILLGSQMWPDNSQGISQEMSGHSRGSQQTPQEVKDMSNMYRSKPSLFNSDGKMLAFNSSKSVGMLDRFEEEKKKAKEKYESDILTNGILQLRESLESTKETLLNRIDGENDNTRNFLVEKIDQFSKTIEGYLNSVKTGLTCHFETLQSQTQTEIADRDAKNTQATKELNSNILNLQRDLEALRAEQSKEQGMLGKILSQLCTLISFYEPTPGPRSARMIDSEVQTSPDLLKRFSVTAEQHQKSKLMCSTAAVYPGKFAEQNQCLTIQKMQNRNVKTLSVQRLQTLGTEQVSLGASEGFWCPQLPEAGFSRQFMDVQSTPSIKDYHRKYKEIPQESEKSLFVKKNEFETDSMSPLKGPKKRQKPLNYRGKKRALVLPQRQTGRKRGDAKYSNESKNENFHYKTTRVPLSSIDNWKITNRSVGEQPFRQLMQSPAAVSPVADQPLLPSSLWSEGTNNCEMMVGYKAGEEENVETKPNAVVLKESCGLWQLFDSD